MWEKNFYRAQRFGLPKYKNCITTFDTSLTDIKQGSVRSIVISSILLWRSTSLSHWKSAISEALKSLN